MVCKVSIQILPNVMHMLKNQSSDFSFSLCQVLNYDVTFNIYVDHSLVRNVSSSIRIRAGEYVVKDLCWKRQYTMALVLKFLIQKMDL